MTTPSSSPPDENRNILKNLLMQETNVRTPKPKVVLQPLLIRPPAHYWNYHPYARQNAIAPPVPPPVPVAPVVPVQLPVAPPAPPAPVRTIQFKYHYSNYPLTPIHYLYPNGVNYEEDFDHDGYLPQSDLYFIRYRNEDNYFDRENKKMTDEDTRRPTYF